MTLYNEIHERQPALLAAEELILDWTEQCPVLLSEKAHDALVERIAALAAENARLRAAIRTALACIEGTDDAAPGGNGYAAVLNLRDALEDA